MKISGQVLTVLFLLFSFLQVNAKFNTDITLHDSDLVHMRQALLPFDIAVSSDKNEVATRYFQHYGVATPERFSFGKMNIAGYDVAAYYFEPQSPRGTVLLFHGYLDHVGTISNLQNHLLDMNYSVLMIDHPGHGLSSGDRASISSFDIYGEVAEVAVNLHKKEKLPGELHVMGHSMGGAIILDLLRVHGKIWDGETILFAPLIRSAHWRISKFGFKLAEPFTDKTIRLFQKSSHDERFLESLKSDIHRTQYFPLAWGNALYNWNPIIESAPLPDIDLTVVQGTDDTTVQWKHNIKLLKKKFPSMKLHMIRDARHHLLNEIVNYRTPVFDIVTDVMSDEKES